MLIVKRVPQTKTWGQFDGEEKRLFSNFAIKPFHILKLLFKLKSTPATFVQIVTHMLLSKKTETTSTKLGVYILNFSTIHKVLDL